MKKLILFIVILFSLACGSVATPEKVVEDEFVPPPVPKQFHVGDTVEIGGVAITVNEVADLVDTTFDPDEGNKFVAVNLSIQNRTAEPVHISTIMQMSLKDTTGQIYKVDLLASNGAPPEGEISPGEKIRGWVGYQVPIEAGGLVFVFDANVFGGGKVFVTL